MTLPKSKTQKHTRSSAGETLRHQFKSLLKERKITYSALAKKLNVAEVTVKRWMTSHDMSFETLARICSILELNPVAIVEKRSAENFLGRQYSEEQEKYFSTHPVETYLFVKAMMGLSFEQLKSLPGQTPTTIIRAMRQMEKVGLIRLLSGNKIRMMVKGPFRWRNNGELQKTYFNSFCESIFDHFRKFQRIHDFPTNSEFAVFRPFEFYLDQATANEFSAEIASVLLKYRSLSHKQVLRWVNPRPVAGFIAVDFFNAWEDVYLNRHNPDGSLKKPGAKPS